MARPAYWQLVVPATQPVLVPVPVVVVPVLPLVPLAPVTPVVLAPPPGWPVPVAFELPWAPAVPVAVAVPMLELPVALLSEFMVLDLQAARLNASAAPISTVWVIFIIVSLLVGKGRAGNAQRVGGGGVVVVVPELVVPEVLVPVPEVPQSPRPEVPVLPLVPELLVPEAPLPEVPMVPELEVPVMLLPLALPSIEPLEVALVDELPIELSELRVELHAARLMAMSAPIITL